MSRDRPNVFSIAPGAPFLATLRDRLMDGTLVPGFAPGGNPLALADVTIYLPTRRAARELRALFAAAHPSGAAILPSIRPLGELDDDAGFLDDDALSLTLMPDIEPEERVLELAKPIRAWGEAMKTNLFGAEPYVVPASQADAVWLARHLADLMDEVAREKGDWKKLDALVPADIGAWWQLTLEFMKIARTYWPDRLAELQRGEPQDRFNRLMQDEAERLRSRGSRGPVIAAGSTGSVPATAELLAAIASLPNGAVVLPGFETEMTGETLAELNRLPVHPSIFGHPQYGLVRLVEKFGMMPHEVVEIGSIGVQGRERNRLISRSLLPPDATHVWATDSIDLDMALDGVTEISAPGEVQEALAIAIALKHALEHGHTPAALVTADRTLARRVSAELERFGIHADDSGGTPLAHTAPAALFQLMLNAVFDGSGLIENLVALLKHPLARLGRKRADTRRFAETLELIWLRGHIAPLTITAILDLLTNKPRLTRIDEDHQPKWWKRFGPKDIENALELGLDLEKALAPLLALKDHSGSVTVSHCVVKCVEALEAIGLDPETGLGALYDGEAGEAFADHLRRLASTQADFDFPALAWPSIHAAMITGKSVKPRFGSDPRIHIWGALEARLQPVETVILGGLNEKVWPQRPSDDPFLSRGMKAGIDLGPPERRTGLAAHDFQMLAGNRRLILTRSARQESAPSVASRWLQRLHAAAGEDAVKAMQARGQMFLDESRKLDWRRDEKRAERPNPKPAVALRPKDFSVTDIETLIRDPYAIHARKILGLEALEDLLREPDALERGKLFHKIAEVFVNERKSAPGTADELMAIGRRLFDEQGLPPEIEISWWRRFERMADNLIAFETGRFGETRQSHVEIKAKPTPVDNTGVTLSGRADRIDEMKDGTAQIIDYKTGTLPSIKQAFQLRSPQLPLEAALMARGAFETIGAKNASDLLYVRLKSDGDVKPESVPATKENADGESADQIGERAWQRLAKMLESYNGESQGYLSRQAMLKENDAGRYDHLARVAEWMSGGDGEDGSETG